jgi:hypothetical protein
MVTIRVLVMDLWQHAGWVQLYKKQKSMHIWHSWIDLNVGGRNARQVI